MKSYAVCPCCSNKLIHHISNHRDYWFCRSCWQEMPAIDIELVRDLEHIHPQSKIINSPLSNLIKQEAIELGTI